MDNLPDSGKDGIDEQTTAEQATKKTDNNDCDDLPPVNKNGIGKMIGTFVVDCIVAGLFGTGLWALGEHFINHEHPFVGEVIVYIAICVFFAGLPLVVLKYWNKPLGVWSSFAALCIVLGIVYFWPPAPLAFKVSRITSLAWPTTVLWLERPIAPAITISPVHIALNLEFTNLKPVPIAITSFTVETEVAGKWQIMPTMDTRGNRLWWSMDLTNARQVLMPDFISQIEGKMIAPNEPVRGFVFLERAKNGTGEKMRLKCKYTNGEEYEQPITYNDQTLDINIAQTRVIPIGVKTNISNAETGVVQQKRGNQA